MTEQQGVTYKTISHNFGGGLSDYSAYALLPKEGQSLDDIRKGVIASDLGYQRNGVIALGAHIYKTPNPADNELKYGFTLFQCPDTLIDKGLAPSEALTAAVSKASNDLADLKRMIGTYDKTLEKQEEPVFGKPFMSEKPTVTGVIQACNALNRSKLGALR